MSRGDLGIPDYRLIRYLSGLYKILAHAFEFHMAQSKGVTHGSNIQSSNQQFFLIYDKTKIVKVFILKLLSNVTVYSLIYDVIFSNFKFCSLLH